MTGGVPPLVTPLIPDNDVRSVHSQQQVGCILLFISVIPHAVAASVAESVGVSASVVTMCIVRTATIRLWTRICGSSVIICDKLFATEHLRIISLPFAS